MGVRFYLAFSNRTDDNTQYEVDLPRAEFDTKLGPDLQGDPWNYFVMQNDGTPRIVINEFSPAAEGVPYFENLFGSPITVSTENEPPATPICINFPPRETSENPMGTDASFSHNFTLPHSSHKVMNLLGALHDLSENQFLSFVSPASNPPKILIVVEEGSPLAPHGITYWQDIFMGQLTNVKGK